MRCFAALWLGRLFASELARSDRTTEILQRFGGFYSQSAPRTAMYGARFSIASRSATGLQSQRGNRACLPASAAADLPTSSSTGDWTAPS